MQSRKLGNCEKNDDKSSSAVSSTSVILWKTQGLMGSSVVFIEQEHGR